MCVYLRAEKPLVYGVVVVAGMVVGWVGTMVVWVVWYCRQSTVSGYEGGKGGVGVVGVCVIAAGAVTLLWYVFFIC